jgi:hypothetical protein
MIASALVAMVQGEAIEIATFCVGYAIWSAFWGQR